MGGERMGGLLQQNTEKLHIDKDFAYKESYAHEGIELGTYSKVKDIDKGAKNFDNQVMNICCCML